VFAVAFPTQASLGAYFDKATSQLPIDLGVRDAILAASLEPAAGRASASDARIWRWLPWLFSFNGARRYDILNAKGETSSRRSSLARKRSRFRVPTTRSSLSGLYPIHPGLLEMGLLYLAREHIDRPLFLPEEETDSAAKRALDRFRSRPTSAGLLDSFNGGLVVAFRKRLQTELRRVGASAEVVDGLMGRWTEPSEFDDGSGLVIAGAGALSRIELPSFASSAMV
jgi:hypothetical protein